MNIAIREASIEDAKTIADFNSRMAKETKGRPLGSALIDAGVVSVVADSNKGYYWVADVGSDVVGQIMVTYEWSDWRNDQLWRIPSAWEHEDYRRKGVCSALSRHVESLARQT